MISSQLSLLLPIGVSRSFCPVFSQNINSPNDNNNHLGDDRSYHNAHPYYHTQHNTTEVPTPHYSCSNKTTNSPSHRNF
jgi:hypothetical protein